jgi:hypothetical protein
VAVVQYTQTIQRTTQNKQNIQQQQNLEECGPCPVFAGFTLAFALQLRKEHTTEEKKHITVLFASVLKILHFAHILHLGLLFRTILMCRSTAARLLGLRV